MPQSLARNLLHLVFSTKNRTPWLNGAIRPELYGYQAVILRNWDSPAILIEGVEDHVHILFVLARTHALCEVIEQVKKGSSKWIKTKGSQYAEFHWQNGYGAFSVSPSNVEAVKRYIANQEEHHKKTTFQEEFREFCRKHGMEFDERYMWD